MWATQPDLQLWFFLMHGWWYEPDGVQVLPAAFRWKGLPPQMRARHEAVTDQVLADLAAYQSRLPTMAEGIGATWRRQVVVVV